MNSKGIYWLASYPKSGNTWFRIVLANLLNESPEPITLQNVQTGAIASCRVFMDEALGFDSADLSHDEIDKLRPFVYTWHGKHAEKTHYHKIHDAYTYIDDKPLIPSQGCLGALYFIRNPLDVVISFANHSACSIDETITYMGDKQFAFCKKKFKQHNQLRQWLLSWSLHVQSWTTAKSMNVLVIRYEDMKKKPLKTFKTAINFLQLNVTEEQIKQALSESSMEKLQHQENQFGFHEKPAKAKSFFRKGIVGDWQDTLTSEQVHRIIQDHGKVMRDFGYVDQNFQPFKEIY